MEYWNDGIFGTSDFKLSMVNCQSSINCSYRTLQNGNIRPNKDLRKTPLGRIGKKRQVLASIGKNWQELARNGKYWQETASTGKNRQQREPGARRLPIAN